MITDKLKNTGVYKKIAELAAFFRIMGVKPRHFAAILISSFLIAFFNGLSLGLLVPLTKGVVTRDFTFLEVAPVLKNIIALAPDFVGAAPAKFLFVLLVGIIFITAIIKSVFEYLTGLYVVARQEEYALRLNEVIFDRYMSFGKLYFDRTSQGYIGGTLGFVRSVTNLFGIIKETLKIFFTLLVYLAIMCFISWKLTVIAIMVFPALHYSVKWIIKRIKKTAELQTNTSLRLGREVFNILSCIALVKAYDKEEEARKKFMKINEELKRWNFSMAKKQNLLNPIQEIIMLTSILLLISIMSYAFMKNQAGTISGFLVFLYLIRRSLPLFAGFNDLKAGLARLEAPIEKVSEVLDDRDKFFVPSGDKMFTGLESKIEFRNMNFAYTEEIPVLKNVNFSFEKGKMTAIVGPTGAGKTTIINLLMRFYDCPAGRLFLDGIDIREFGLKSLKKHKALVSQDALLLNDTLRNNIAFGVGRKVSDKELIEVARKARLEDFIMKLPQGLDTEVGDLGVKLSGGEKQRVSIARALLKDAEILILDEATSSLDTTTEKAIQEAIEEAVKGRTTIVIAHRLSTVKNANKIIVIENGRLVEEGALDELLAKKGKFYEYWEAQRFY